MTSNGGKSLRRFLVYEGAALFWAALAIWCVTMSHPWFAIAWAWLAGSQFTLAAWLRNEQHIRDSHD